MNTSTRLTDPLEGLNTEQAQAVETIYGPVMVIAGPGTGKTTLLSHRIANILLKTDTDARSILCLTFTDAGVKAMRAKLHEKIGAEAYNINIHTFHSFCNSIIKQYNSFFDQTKELELIDEIEKFELLSSLLDEMPPENPLKKLSGRLYYEVGRLDNFFNTIKKENYDPEQLLINCERYMNELPNLEKFQYSRKYKEHAAGDPKQKDIDKERESISKTVAATHAYNNYLARMKEMGRYDFWDMIRWVVDKMQNDSGFAASLRERYQFLLVDEYQDTNGIQNALLFELAGDPEEQPNIFIVGDEDQAIYRFQGANITSITDFFGRFQKNLNTILLKKNYRSGPEILAAARNLISHKNKEESLDASQGAKSLMASGLNKDYTDALHRLDAENTDSEYIAVTKHLQQLHTQGVAWKDMAIIYVKHALGDPFMRYFEALDIPYEVLRTEDVLKNPLIHKLITCLEYVNNELQLPFSADQQLYQMLYYDWFGIAPFDVARLSVLHNQARKERNYLSWRTFLNEKKWVHAYQWESQEEIEDFIKIVEHWILTAANSTVQVLFERMIYTREIRSALFDGDYYDLNGLTLINTFFDFIKEQAARKPDMQLNELIELLKQMVEYDMSLRCETLQAKTDGVKMMSAHGSKGLEFEHVIVFGSNESNWESRFTPHNNYKLPPEYTNTEEEKAQKVEDLRRLFYVAMTRAERGLVLSSAQMNLKAKQLSPSRFVGECEEGIASITIPSIDVEVTSFDFSNFLINKYRPVDPIDKAMLGPYLDARLEDVKLNITGVNKYLRCPKSFFFENVLRAPAARTASMGYGNAIHRCLQYAYTKKDEMFMLKSEAEILDIFLASMDKYSSHFNAQEKINYSDKGREVLPPFIAHLHATANPIQLLNSEHTTNNVEISGIPVKGVFDRVIRTPDVIRITDYKTGNEQNISKKLKAAKPNDELKEALKQERDPEIKQDLKLKYYGGDYWRQLVFYDMLFRKDMMYNNQALTVDLAMVEAYKNPDKYEQRIDVTNEARAIVTDQLKMVYQAIQDRAFDEGCGLDNCRWCKV